MKILPLLEAEQSKNRFAVIYGGRFQPFHRGHYEGYLWLTKKFGYENVWVAMSDRVNFDQAKGDVSPFTFDERVEMMVALFEMKVSRIIKCKNPAFAPAEVFKEYRGVDPVYIAAVGKKNEDRYNNNPFFKPYDDQSLEELSPVSEKVGYYVTMPIKSSEISGTKIRAALANVDDRNKKALFKKYFGKYDKFVDETITYKLSKLK